jgi:hypothetical protein
MLQNLEYWKNETGLCQDMAKSCFTFIHTRDHEPGLKVQGFRVQGFKVSDLWLMVSGS